MNQKQQAAASALKYVKSGMTIGLGSGSTTAYFVDMLGEKLSAGKLSSIRAVPTSEATGARARKCGIPITTLSECPRLDLAVDGADEVDPALNLIKGLGRALLREKIVAVHAERFIVIVDESKLVPTLGSRGPLPIEVVTFEADAHIQWLNTLDCRAEQWHEDDGSPVVTDNGNYLARCWFDDGITDAYELARTLSLRPGIVDHGLFLDMATEVVVAGENDVRAIER